ncbi:MAG: biosynthetic-type acetolactate synthase large subunit [Thermoanaerobaculia bacterium]|nr:biosynthetic-type acetolactate synthase large subunit [Thermoanaerobaculia bacterium]
MANESTRVSDSARAAGQPEGGRELTGAEIVCACLQREGVDVVFGYPGGAILPTYDALCRSGGIHHVLTRHEQGASHMADGYARSSGRVGVAIATSGPGATNLVTGIATAMMDSSPLVCLTGQVSTTVLGSDAFQEADVLGITMPITKHNVMVTRVEDLAEILHEAFAIARSGRPGPVVVDLPKDVQLARTLYDPDRPLPVVPVKTSMTPLDAEIEAARNLIAEARRPVILAGNGINISGASEQLRRLAEDTGIPVSLTLLGKGAFPEDHPLSLGMMGMHGDAAANLAIQAADLIIALGMRFDDRVTGTLSTYAPKSKKIHVDLDRSEIGKNVAVDVGVVGDLKAVLTRLLVGIAATVDEGWTAQIREWKDHSKTLDVVHQPCDGRLWAARVIRDLCELTDGEAVTVTDVGQHQMFEAQYYTHRRPRTLITSGGLGTMGFGLPAALGAKLAQPHEEVWAIVGDGGFQMTLAELATAVQEQIAVKIAIINNGYLGMVRQWQELFYEERYYATPLANPDFCKIAEAYGVPSVRVSQRRDVAPAVAWCRSVNDGPCLVEFVVESHDVVYPMVPAGAALDEMIRRPARASTMAGVSR